MASRRMRIDWILPICRPTNTRMSDCPSPSHPEPPTPQMPERVMRGRLGPAGAVVGTHHVCMPWVIQMWREGPHAPARRPRTAGSPWCWFPGRRHRARRSARCRTACVCVRAGRWASTDRQLQDKGGGKRPSPPAGGGGACACGGRAVPGRASRSTRRGPGGLRDRAACVWCEWEVVNSGPMTHLDVGAGASGAGGGSGAAGGGGRRGGSGVRRRGGLHDLFLWV
jgi:hypothetical protein